jgi:hypothetical protein
LAVWRIAERLDALRKEREVVQANPNYFVMAGTFARSAMLTATLTTGSEEWLERFRSHDEAHSMSPARFGTPVFW